MDPKIVSQDSNNSSKNGLEVMLIWTIIFGVIIVASATAFVTYTKSTLVQSKSQSKVAQNTASDNSDTSDLFAEPTASYENPFDSTDTANADYQNPFQ